jgi:hypothetical protein
MFSEIRFPRRPEAVEKVVVGAVGSPKQVPNKLKTLQKRGSKPLKQGSEKGTKEFFNTLHGFWNTFYSPTKPPVLRLQNCFKTHTNIIVSVLADRFEF